MLTEAQREYQRLWARRPENLPMRRRAALAHARRITDYLYAVKDVPCMDCGGRFPPYVMDFDHVRGEKSFNISNRARSIAREKLEEEIAKCDIVCANCHRIRTHLRREQSAGDR